MSQKAPEICFASCWSPASILRRARTAALLSVAVLGIYGVSGPKAARAQGVERIDIDPRRGERARVERESPKEAAEREEAMRAFRLGGVPVSESPAERLRKMLQGLQEGQLKFEGPSLSKRHFSQQELVDLGINLAPEKPGDVDAGNKLGVQHPGRQFRTPPLLGHTSFLDEILGTSEEVRIQNRLAVLDVTNRGGKVTVSVSRGSDYLWLGESLNSKLTPNRTFEITSTDDMDLLLGKLTTVVHRGDPLPEAWSRHLRQRGQYLRNSRHSPKDELGDFIHAAEALNRRAEPGRVRVLSALPNDEGWFGLRWQLHQMGLDVGEASGWSNVQKEINAVRSKSAFPVESATKESVLQELRAGSSETVVVVAHNNDGLLHFPDGSTLSLAELSALSRLEAPDRTLVLISCDAGVVNGRTLSASEVVVKHKLALNVLAHPAPISATEVPAMLEDFLINGKTIKESFPMLTPVTENQTIRIAPNETNGNG